MRILHLSGGGMRGDWSSHAHPICCSFSGLLFHFIFVKLLTKITNNQNKKKSKLHVLLGYIASKLKTK